MLGGAAGIDTMALDWLTGLDRPGEARLSIQKARERGLPVTIAERRHPSGVVTDAWTARNMFMVEESQVVIGFPATDVPDHAQRGSGS